MTGANRYRPRVEENEGGWRVVIVDPSGNDVFERPFQAEGEARMFASTTRPGAKNQAGLQAEILDAIRSGRDLWVFDQIIEGPDRLEHARQVLIEKRDACSSAYEAAFLTSIIRGLG